MQKACSIDLFHVGLLVCLGCSNYMLYQVGNNWSLFSSRAEDCKLKTRVSFCKMVTLWLCFQNLGVGTVGKGGRQRQRQRESQTDRQTDTHIEHHEGPHWYFIIYFCQTQAPDTWLHIMRTFPPRFSSQNTISVGFRFQHMSLGRDTIRCNRHILRSP